MATISLMTALGLLLSACGDNDDRGGDAVTGSDSSTSIPAYDGPSPSAENPVKVGILYTDDNPIGVSPEIKDAAEAAEQYINTHGGMDGRTLEVVPCNGQNNPQSGARCASQFVENDVVTVYGLDGVWGGVGVSVIGRAGIVNQTLPISGPEFTSENAYPWQGSGVTAAAAAASYAAEQGGKAACVYTEVASFKEQCLHYFGDVADKLGVTWEGIPIPPTANDLAQYTTKVSGTRASTVLVISGGQVAQQLINSGAQLGFKPKWIVPSQRPDFWKAVGANGEGVITFGDQKDANDPKDEDAALFRAVMNRYAPNAAYTAFSTMTFSNLVTLQRLAKQVGGDKITAKNMPDLLSAIKLDQFLGPELDAKKALPQYPRAVHTGAYLYKRVGDGVEPVGKGYYEVPA